MVLLSRHLRRRRRQGRCLARRWWCQPHRSLRSPATQAAAGRSLAGALVARIGWPVPSGLGRFGTASAQGFVRSSFGSQDFCRGHSGCPHAGHDRQHQQRSRRSPRTSPSSRPAARRTRLRRRRRRSARETPDGRRRSPAECRGRSPRRRCTSRATRDEARRSAGRKPRARNTARSPRRRRTVV